VRDEINDEDNKALYPNKGSDGDSRPLLFDKPTIFISSRVHCGETCASFFVQGILDFLSSDTD